MSFGARSAPISASKTKPSGSLSHIQAPRVVKTLKTYVFISINITPSYACLQRVFCGHQQQFPPLFNLISPTSFLCRPSPVVACPQVDAYEPCVEHGGNGNRPRTPKTAPPANSGFPADGYIKHGVAKLRLADSPVTHECCDVVLGQSAAKVRLFLKFSLSFSAMWQHQAILTSLSSYFHFLLQQIFPRHMHHTAMHEGNTVALCAMALQRVKAAAGTTTTGSTDDLAASLQYFLFVEKVIELSGQEYLGPRALSFVVELMSYLSFSAAVSNVLIAQHVSLAKKATETLAACAAYEPSSVDVEMVVRAAEARARAPAALKMGAAQSGATFAKRQQALLGTFGEGNMTPSQAARMVVAWSALEKRFEHKALPNEVDFVCLRLRSQVAALSWGELEKIAGALEVLGYAPNDTLRLLRAICKEAVYRLSWGKGSAAEAGAVLAVALHSANCTRCPEEWQKLRADVNIWFAEQGLDTSCVEIPGFSI